MRTETVALIERVIDFPIHAGQACWRHILLRRSVVAVLILKAEIQAIVDENLGLLRAHVTQELRSTPCVALMRRIGIVKPDRREWTVVRE